MNEFNNWFVRLDVPSQSVCVIATQVFWLLIEKCPQVVDNSPGGSHVVMPTAP